MPVPVGPFAVPALGVPLLIPVPSGSYTSVVIDNSSAFACKPNIGGPQHWLGAFCSDRYDVPAGATVSITPTVALAAYAGVSYVTATFYTDSDPMLDNYPSLLAVTGTLAVSGSVTTAGLAAMTTPVVTGVNRGQSSAYSNLSPFSGVSASLGYLGVTAIFYGIGSIAAPLTVSVSGIGWAFDQTSVTLPASSSWQFLTFLAWKVIGGADISGNAPIITGPALGVGGAVWTGLESIYVGVASGPWQNTGLAGAQSAPMTWSVYGGTCPITSSVPALYVAPLWSSTLAGPTSTVPGTIYAPASPGVPQESGYCQLYYSATGRSGAFNVQTTTNGSPPFATVPQSGLIVPQ